MYDSKGKHIQINSYSIRQVKKNPTKYIVRQSSSCDNSLGVVEFQFPNKFGIHLHDSPHQELFDRGIRALSRGCVRVQKAKELAELLLRYDGSESKIPVMQKAIGDYQKRNFKLKNPVPIKITYLTCTIQDGLPVFYKDIYHLDDALETQLYGINNIGSSDSL
ncbi:L,D-transpeptidase family protein [Pedobacter steynii]